MFFPDVGIIPLDYGQSGCADYVVLQEFDVGEYWRKLTLHSSPLISCTFFYLTVNEYNLFCLQL
jgi:hypothetical protein